ncbi:MAG TPA: GFA family protein [Phenylobacterium sp.]
MIHASCCCGGVRFELTAPPTMMGTCHCSRCRKAGAGAFVFVRRDSFRWLAGRELVETFRAEPPYVHDRSFCRRCGTALGEPLAAAESFPINAHCLDDDPGVRNRFHEFVGEKPTWYEICDAAPQFAAHPVKSSPPPVS